MAATTDRVLESCHESLIVRRGTVVMRLQCIAVAQKWFQCFEDVTSILFLASSSEFDQVLMEDRRTNRLQVKDNPCCKFSIFRTQF